MDTEYIKKCPFCSGLSEPRRYYNSYEGTKYFIECIQCGATSSHRPTEEYAVEQWNKRVEEAQYKQRTSKIAEKVEPKKYYLKHKYLIGVDVGDVNRSVCSNGWFFTNDAILCHTQMKFTEEEIKELENEGLVLENYRKVEVEDE